MGYMYMYKIFMVIDRERLLIMGISVYRYIIHSIMGISVYIIHSIVHDSEQFLELYFAKYISMHNFSGIAQYSRTV